MLGLWVLSQLAIYVAVCWLSFHYIFIEKEYFSEDFDAASRLNNNNE